MAAKKHWEEVEATMEGSTTKLILTQVEIRGILYAAAPVVVHLGGSNLSMGEPTFAVACEMRPAADLTTGRQKHINLRSYCEGWLCDRGLSDVEADMLLMLAEAADAGRAEKVPPLIVQESKGGYEEEVQKMIDEIESSIADGFLKTRQEAWTALETRCKGSAYASDYTLCLTTLLWAGRAVHSEFPEVKRCAKQILTTVARSRLRQSRSFLKLG